MSEEIFYFICFICFVIFFYGVSGAMVAVSKRGWPETIGKILKNEEIEELKRPYAIRANVAVSKHTLRAVGDDPRRKALRLSYVYVVGGVKYIGNQLYSTPTLQFKPTKIFGLYPGDKVKVFYNEEYPESCFLAHSFSWPGWAIALFGVVCFCVAVYFRFVA